MEGVHVERALKQRKALGRARSIRPRWMTVGVLREGMDVVLFAT